MFSRFLAALFWVIFLCTQSHALVDQERYKSLLEDMRSFLVSGDCDGFQKMVDRYYSSEESADHRIGVGLIVLSHFEPVMKNHSCRMAPSVIVGSAIEHLQINKNVENRVRGTGSNSGAELSESVLETALGGNWRETLAYQGVAPLLQYLAWANIVCSMSDGDNLTAGDQHFFEALLLPNSGSVEFSDSDVDLFGTFCAGYKLEKHSVSKACFWSILDNRLHGQDTTNYGLVHPFRQIQTLLSFMGVSLQKKLLNALMEMRDENGGRPEQSEMARFHAVALNRALHDACLTGLDEQTVERLQNEVASLPNPDLEQFLMSLDNE